MTYEEMKELPVLDGIIRETLRLHSPIHTIMVRHLPCQFFFTILTQTQRMVISDIVVPRALSAPSEDGQYIIPKGHTAVASPAFTQIDRKIWKNHAEWDPYRWIDPSGEAALALQEYLTGEKVDYGYGFVSKGTESVYQPFGAGRHRCIGEHVSRPSAFVIFTGDLGIPPSSLTSRSDVFWSPSSETLSSSSTKFPPATTA